MKTLPRPAPRLLSFLVGSVCLLGCDSKVSQCNKMVDLLNGAASKMETLQPNEKDLSQSAKTTRDMSNLASQTVQELEKLEITNEGLKQHAEAYRQVLVDMAKGTGAMAGYMEEMAKLESQSNGEANAKLESTREAIESQCKTATDECRKITEVMSVVPSDAKEDELPDVLGVYASRLKALELTGDLKGAVDNHVAAVEEFIGIVRRAEELQTQADAAQAELDNVVSREEKLVAEINGYCVGNPKP